MHGSRIQMGTLTLGWTCQLLVGWALVLAWAVIFSWSARGCSNQSDQNHSSNPEALLRRRRVEMADDAGCEQYTVEEGDAGQPTALSKSARKKLHNRRPGRQRRRRLL
jgi:hypothetical protein